MFGTNFKTLKRWSSEKNEKNVFHKKPQDDRTELIRFVDGVVTKYDFSTQESDDCMDRDGPAWVMCSKTWLIRSSPLLHY